MGKSTPPPPPDPTATVAAQSQANTQNLVQNSEMNRINQYGPSGSVTYQISGYNPDGTPQYTQNSQLSPELQNIFSLGEQGGTGLLNTAIGMEGQVNNSYANPIDASGIPPVMSGPGAVQPVNFNAPQPGNVSQSLNLNGQPPLATSAGYAGPIQSGIAPTGIPLATGASANGGPSIMGAIDTSRVPGMTSAISNSGPAITGQVNGGQTWQDAVKQAQNAAYQSSTQYLDPQFSQQQDALNAQLANEGVDPTSHAAQVAQDNLARQRQAAYSDARNQAIQLGDQEQNVLYGQGLSSAQLQNAANAQGFGQGQTAAELQNSVNAQAYGQAANNAQFTNAANAQAFGQSATNAGILNAAEAQQFGQNQAQQQAANAAQAQAFGQGATNAGIQNTANQQAYNQAMGAGQFANQAEAQQYGEAQSNFAAGNAAQQQQYGQGVQNAELNNAASQQAIQNLFALRNQPLNEFDALMSGSQVQQPSLPLPGVPGAQVSPVNAAGIIQQGYGNQLGYSQLQNAGINNLFSLGGQLGGAAIMASDRRLKRNIERVGTHASGIPAYLFQYKSSPEWFIGAMADEVRDYAPHAVYRDPSGFDLVDYGALG